MIKMKKYIDLPILWQDPENKIGNKITKKSIVAYQCNKCKQRQHPVRIQNLRKKMNKFGICVCLNCSHTKPKLDQLLPIDWKKSKELGTDTDTYIRTDLVYTKCSYCKKIKKIKISSLRNIYKKNKLYRCKSCTIRIVSQTEEYQQKVSEGVKKAYQRDQSYLQKVKDNLNKARIKVNPKNISKAVKRNWQNPEFIEKWKKSINKSKEKRSKFSKKMWNNPEKLEKLRQKLKEIYNTSEKKKYISKRSIKQWQNEEYHKKTLGRNYYTNIKEFKEKQKRNYFKRQKRHKKNRSITQIFKNLLRDKQNDKRNLEISIKLYHIIDLWNQYNGHCALSGIRMSLKPHDLHKISIDRIDSNKGYLPNNIQLICQFLNFAKHNLPNEEMKKLIKDYRDNNNPIFEELNIKNAKKWIKNYPLSFTKLSVFYVFSYQLINNRGYSTDTKSKYNAFYIKAGS